MEASPSTQSVGTEFIRQYYTLLNQAPTHLHRFYNNQSSFVHEGLDPTNRDTSPVFGQKQIHQEIQKLNFRDCYAKITQIDSQATLGNGIVMQVTGELSNASQPMRRFTQTVVLAAESPKKYYVYNSIFRYQDEIVSDVSTVQPYSNPNAGQDQPIPTEQPPPHVITAQPVPDHIPAIQPQALGAPMSTLQPSTSQAPLNLPAPIEEEQTREYKDEVKKPLEEQQKVEPEHDMSEMDSASNHPKTYASLLKSGGAVRFTSTPSKVPSATAAVVQPTVAKSVMPPTSGGRGNDSIKNIRGGFGVNQQQPRLQNRQDSGRGVGRKLFNEDTPYKEKRRPQNQNFNVVNQLFLGNLPHIATEDKLRDIFGEFGMIVDLRVHSNPPGNVGVALGGRVPPNYGFIVYDNQQGAQNCLQAKSIFYPKDDKNGIPLNVEKTKTKERSERPPYGGGPPMENRGPRRGLGSSGGHNRNSSGGSRCPSRPNNRNRRCHQLVFSFD